MAQSTVLDALLPSINHIVRYTLQKGWTRTYIYGERERGEYTRHGMGSMKIGEDTLCTTGNAKGECPVFHVNGGVLPTGLGAVVTSLGLALLATGRSPEISLFPAAIFLCFGTWLVAIGVRGLRREPPVMSRFLPRE